jgi:hypothetical protein
MIEILRKTANKWLFLGLLAAGGCTSAVKPEEFNAYKTQSEKALITLKEELSAEQKKALLNANARYDALIKNIEELNARLSVSSIDSYAIGLEEQTTQNARRYAQLARAIAKIQKKEWDLGDTANSEITKLRAETKTSDDSLAKDITELRKLLDNTKKAYETFKNSEYQSFKDQSLQESAASQKRAEAFENSLRNLAQIIERMEGNKEASKAVEGIETKVFVFTARATFENPVTYAMAMDQWRREVEYRKANGEPVNDDAMTRIYRFAQAAGPDDIIQKDELKTSNFDEKVEALKRKDGEAYKELNPGKLTITNKTDDTASARVIANGKQQEEWLRKLREYKTNKQETYIAAMLNFHLKDGRISNAKLEYVAKKAQETFEEKK